MFSPGWKMTSRLLSVFLGLTGIFSSQLIKVGMIWFSITARRLDLTLFWSLMIKTSYWNEAHLINVKTPEERQQHGLRSRHVSAFRTDLFQFQQAAACSDQAPLSSCVLDVRVSARLHDDDATMWPVCDMYFFFFFFWDLSSWSFWNLRILDFHCVKHLPLLRAEATVVPSPSSRLERPNCFDDF